MNLNYFMKIFGGCPLSSCMFDIYLGTSLTQPTAEERFTIESVSIQADCWKDVNKILKLHPRIGTK